MLMILLNVSNQTQLAVYQQNRKKINTQNRNGKATIKNIRQQRDANLDARSRCSWQNK